jgi:hypothetical protein
MPELAPLGPAYIDQNILEMCTGCKPETDHATIQQYPRRLSVHGAFVDRMQ